MTKKYVISEDELVDLLKRYEHNKGFFDELIPVTLINFLKNKQPIEELARGIYHSGEFDLEKDWIKFIIKDLRVTCSADGLVNNKVRILAEVSK